MPSFESAAGTSLHYELRGEGPLLVCQPGGPGRPVSYLDTLGGLDRTRTLVLLDPRGVGTSAPADSYSFAALGDDLEALRQHLGCSQLDLLGHSAGAWPALQYASQHPMRVRRLVLLTPSRRLIPPLPDEPDQLTLAQRWFGRETWFPAAFSAYTAFDPSAAEPTKNAVLEAAAPLLYGSWDRATQVHATRPHDSTSAPAPRDGFWSASFDLSHLAAVASPVTIIAGGRDIVCGEAAPADLAGRLPNASVEWLPGCGHFPWLNDPGAVASTVEEALR